MIEGFGASTTPFDAFDKAFKRDLGFEASIGVRLVTQAQCPAIKFLSQLGSNQARAPRINLDSVEVKNGETLSGTIENFANRVVELLLVSDGGEVQNLSYLLKPGTDSLSFSIGMQRSGGGEGPQLVHGGGDAAGSRFPAAAQTHGRRHFLPAGDQRGPAQQCGDRRGSALFSAQELKLADRGEIRCLGQKRPMIRIFRSPSGLKSAAVNSSAFGAVGFN